ncbi:helix-turn-helix domain-containing protein [Streptomyces sp. NPDC012637]|uniref:helix-turn-helix domain-containing protein n=1 Tax=Streptomyces sp. NPDC012637 TaxID=3364842 RepID=UPI0036EF8D37
MSEPEQPEQPEESYEEEEQSTALNRAIGKQLKLLRERAGLTQRELGDRLGYSEDLISSLERGRRTPQREFLEAADELLGAGGLLKAAIEDVEKAKAQAKVRHPEWFKGYARLESSAVEINFYSTLAPPGLLQTEDFMRTVLNGRQPLLSEETVEQRVASRLARQEILTRWPAPMVTALIDESVLRRRLGGHKVWQGQLEHLLRLARLRNITLQVLPLDSEENPGVDGPFILLTPKGKQQVGYLEVQGVGQLITHPEEVRILAARYGSIRGQALTPRESLALMQELLGEP